MDATTTQPIQPMKRFLFLIFAATAVSHLPGAGVDERKTVDEARRTASDLFVAGHGTAAVAYLQSHVAANSGPDGATTALVQNLIEISNRFYNRRQMSLAREAGRQAIVAADSLVKGRSAASPAQVASLVGSLGLLAEQVLYDPTQAGTLYDAAAALNPAEPLFRQRKDAMVQKQKPGRGPGG